MTREEAIEYLKRDNGNCDTDCKYCKYNNDCRSYKSRKMAIEALEKEPCEDAISRNEVDTLVDELARAISDERCCISRGRSTATIMQDILDLPSVQPAQRVGKWIYKNLKGQFCSICDEQSVWKFNYCPSCGARMAESEE